MSIRKNTRLIFDRDFYILQGIFSTDKYKRVEAQVKKQLVDLGLPIPKTGFTVAKEYMEWYEKVKNKGLNPKDFLKEIASKFGIDIENTALELGLRRKFFFNSAETQTKPLIRLKEDNDGLWLKIAPWTKKEDLINFWEKEIKPLQKNLRGYRGKEKPWENFDKDFKVYMLFLRVKQDLQKGIKKHPAIKSNSPYTNIAYYPEFDAIKKIYHDNNLEDELRSIVSRCRKVFGNLQLL